MEKIKNLKLFILDNDDVMFRSSPLIQFYVEKNFPKFATKILKTRERAISIIQYQYDQIEREIKRARTKGVIPNLPEFNIMRNDVIKTDSDEDSDFYYEYYRKPLVEIGEVLEMAKHDKEMFLEDRDATVERDGKLLNGVIPYDEIYKEENWMPYVRENVVELYKMFGDKLISLTAHNGIDDMHGREFEEKGRAVHKMVEDIPHIGLRFHAWEHIDGERRQRNSKGQKIMQVYDLPNLHGVVAVDDSMDNCLDIYKNGGTPILVSQNKTNPYGFATVKSIKPESILRELEKLNFMSNDENEILQKPKRLVR